MLCIQTAQANLLRAEVNPRKMTVGDTGEILLVSNADLPRVEKLPKLKWLEWLDGATPLTGQQRTYVKGEEVKRYSARYRFRAKKEGKHEMPALTVVEGNRKQQVSLGVVTVEVRRVLRNGKQVNLEELVFLRLTSGGRKLPNTAWVGEAVPLTVDVCIDSQLRVHDNTLNDQNNYFPSVDLNNVSYRDYAEYNRYNSKMLYYPRRQERINGRLTSVYRYELVMLPVEPGAVSGAVSHSIPLVFSSGKSNQRSAFEMLMEHARIIPHKVRAPLGGITAKALPAVPQDRGEFVGLIGDWKLTLETSRDEVRAGEGVELILRAEGSGNLESFRPPELVFPGVRVYEPEITRVVAPKTSVEVKWLLVPHQAGAILPPFSLCSFAAKKGEFRTHEFMPTLKVLAGEQHLNGAAPPLSSSGGDVPMLQREDRPRQQDILSMQVSVPTYVTFPLWQNVFVPSVSLFFLGPLFLFACWWIANRRDRLNGDESQLRIRAAKRKRSELLRQLEGAPDSEVYVTVRERLVPWLIEYLDLPRGTTVSELAGELTDEDLKKILQAAQEGAFMPGSQSTATGRDVAAKVKALCTTLLVAGILVGLLSPTQSQAADAAQVMSDASERYLEQKFDEAAHAYRALDRKGQGSWEIAYNLGNCSFRQEKYAEAVAHYERALRLAPRESDILQNLNFTRAQLGMSRIRSGQSPSEALSTGRDYFRPDEWFFIAAIGWFALFVWLGIDRLMNRRTRPWVMIPVAIILIGGLAGYTQQRSTYKTGQAMIVASDAVRCPLPGAEPVGSGNIIKAGHRVLVLEQRAAWSRIRVDDAEGWIQNTDYQLIW